MNPLEFPSLSPSRLAEAADDNFALHAAWVQRQLDGMQVSPTPELLRSDSGLATDTFNIVCRARLEPLTAPHHIEKTLAYFRRVARPFSWWHSPADTPKELPDLLQGAGLEPAESEIAMAADLGALRATDAFPAALRIERVRHKGQLQDFARVMAANWSPPDPLVGRFYELAAPLLLSDGCPLWYYVGYVDDEPVAISQLTVGGGVVGLYNIATLEGFRRRGFGNSMTLRPLLDARKEGWRTGVLQASAQGAGVYARVGFEPFGEITEFKPTGV